MKQVEALVVGSGPGGAVTGALLAEAGRQVLMLEEGQRIVDQVQPFSRQELEAAYRNGGLTAALGATKVQYVEACCVGGGSQINSGLYHRIPPVILDSWRRQFAVQGLAESDLEPFFAANEEELKVSLSPRPAPMPAQRLARGARRQGWSSQEVPRWVDYSDPDQAEQPFGGVRRTMERTFLKRFQAAGGQLLQGRRALRFWREGHGWTVESRDARGQRMRHNSQSLFLCGGAIQTPNLLAASGMRPPQGFPLQMHPTVKLVVEFAEPVNHPGDGVAAEQVKHFAPWLSFGCSISSMEHLQLALLDHPQVRPRAQREPERFAIYYACIIPTGRGQISRVFGFHDPLVRMRLSPADHSQLGLGLRRLSQLFLEDGALAVYPSLSHPESGSIRRGSNGLMTIHLFSSLPMAENEGLSPLDSYGRFRQQPGLYCNDGSLLCSAPGVNPQGGILAVARRNVAYFLGQL